MNSSKLQPSHGSGNPPSLAGKTAVVTGASSGIGRAIALRFAACGARVVVHAGQNRDAAQSVAGMIKATGSSAKVVVADISQVADRERLVEEAWSWDQAAGGIDVWVNNAGADVLTGDAAKWTFEEKLTRLWQVDVVGTLALSRAVGDRMQAAGVGVILNMGWDQAATGQGGDSGELFATTKGAIMAFSRSLARSLAPAVRVNCLAPGWIKTSWGEQIKGYWDERARGESFLDRWGTVKDVANAAEFLASDAGAFINGHILPINGGAQPWPNTLTRRDGADAKAEG